MFRLGPSNPVMVLRRVPDIYTYDGLMSLSEANKDINRTDEWYRTNILLFALLFCASQYLTERLIFELYLLYDTSQGIVSLNMASKIPFKISDLQAKSCHACFQAL